MTDSDSADDKHVIEVKEFDEAFRDLTEEEREWYENTIADLDDGPIDHELKIGEVKQLADGTAIERTEDGLRLYTTSD